VKPSIDSLALWPARSRMRPPEGEFRCMHCRRLVLADWRISGVHNRNHCPYCLHSRHLDLRRPGDRLAACKGPMEPVGLTLKRTLKKYGLSKGELMLIHCCQECGQFSINRIAADDDHEAVWDIYENSWQLESEVGWQLRQLGIQPLAPGELMEVEAQLFGVIVR
jgi:hypothetical protein